MCAEGGGKPGRQDIPLLTYAAGECGFLRAHEECSVDTEQLVNDCSLALAEFTIFMLKHPCVCDTNRKLSNLEGGAHNGGEFAVVKARIGCDEHGGEIMLPHDDLDLRDIKTRKAAMNARPTCRTTSTTGVTASRWLYTKSDRRRCTPR
jgi:hypothetical protein